MGLTFIAIVLLAGAWAAILLPDLRNRGGGGRSGSSRGSHSAKSFRQHLSGLDRTRPIGSTVRPRGELRPLASRGAATPGASAPRPSGAAPRAGHAPRPQHGPGPTAGTRRATRPQPVGSMAHRSSMLPRNRAEAAQRRLITLAVLVGLALVTLVGGLVAARALLFVHLLVDAALGGFVFLLWERSARTRTRRSSLATLADRPGLGESSSPPLLRREASGN